MAISIVKLVRVTMSNGTVYEIPAHVVKVINDLKDALLPMKARAFLTKHYDLSPQEASDLYDALIA